MPQYLSRYSDMSHPTIPFLYTFYPQVTLSKNSACRYKASFALFKIINLTIPIRKICPVPFLFIRHRHLPALSCLWTRKSLRIQYFTIYSLSGIHLCTGSFKCFRTIPILLCRFSHNKDKCFLLQTESALSAVSTSLSFMRLISTSLAKFSTLSMDASTDEVSWIHTPSSAISKVFSLSRSWKFSSPTRNNPPLPCQRRF